jgi:hypothetical protein
MNSVSISVEVIYGIASLFVIPWCVWVTISLFNQRQEVALLKQILGVMMKSKGS